MKNSRKTKLGELRPEDLRNYRRTKHESQGLFWARFGVTQSRGSRFEQGAEIPKPVAILLDLYLNGILTDRDLAAGHHRERSHSAVSQRAEHRALSAEAVPVTG